MTTPAAAVVGCLDGRCCNPMGRGGNSWHTRAEMQGGFQDLGFTKPKSGLSKAKQPNSVLTSATLAAELLQTNKCCRVSASTPMHPCTPCTQNHTSTFPATTCSNLQGPRTLEPQQALLLLRQSCLHCCQVGQDAVTRWTTQAGPWALRLIEPAQLRQRICRDTLTPRGQTDRVVKGGASE